MKTFVNIIIVNGEKYTNIVWAKTYNEARKIQKERKSKGKDKFEGRLTLAND